MSMAKVPQLSAVVGKMRAAAAAIPAAERSGITAAGQAMQAAVVASARGRGWKPGGSWVKVTNRAGSDPSALVELRGSRAYWAERGTKAHKVTPKRKKAILTPAGPRASASVRGARARPFWRAGVGAGQTVAVAAHQKVVGAALRRAL